jgi:hypothetical protein
MSVSRPCCSEIGKEIATVAKTFKPSYGAGGMGRAPAVKLQHMDKVQVGGAAPNGGYRNI